MKKKLLIALIAFMALAAFAPMSRVYADAPLNAKVLNFSKTIYHIYNSPSDIFYTPKGLYVSTQDGCDIYNNGEFRLQETRADDFAYIEEISDGLVILSDGNIIYGDDQINGSYTAISTFGNTLYALSGKTISKFVYANGKFSDPQKYDTDNVPDSSSIENIAATDTGCIYTIKSGSTYTIYPGNGQDPIRLYRPLIDIEYNGALYVLTSNSIIMYIDGNAAKTYPLIDPTNFTIGDRVYVLSWNGAIESIALDLSESSAYTMIASISDIDWFYHAPVRSSSRLGKIYVADQDLDRVAVIEGTNISYIKEGLNRPVAAVSDNTGKVYVAHSTNHIACFEGGKLISDEKMAEDAIVDIEVDYNNNIFFLTQSGDVINSSKTIVISGINAFEYQNGWHYLTDGYIDDLPISAKDFCLDASGNIFATDGNKLIAIVSGKTTEYTIGNAAHISTIAISKADNAAVSYGDLILVDDVNKCVLVLDGSLVGSVNLKTLYSQPDLTNTPIDRSDEKGIIARVSETTYMFSLPIEGEISYTLNTQNNVIICDDISSPEPFVYCISDDKENKTLKRGYVYKDKLHRLSYTLSRYDVGKVVTDNTPIYKYPTIHSLKLTDYEKNKLVTILPFVANYKDNHDDGWYMDDYENLWYRIAYGDKEGYVRAGDVNVNDFFSMDAKPIKTNATIIQDATIYRYDESTGEYVEFHAAGLFLAKDTRVAVIPPFDTSHKYTKISFYREGYGTIDTDCYVETKNIKYDGVDIIKIIAIAVIVVAFITLILVIIRRRKISRRPQKNPPIEYRSYDNR